MKRRILLGLGSSIFCLFPNLSWAVCMDMGAFSTFNLEGGNTVVLYAGPVPVARFDVQNCDVQPSSKIQLIKTNVCDGDEILIDGSKCVMMQIKALGP